MYLINKEGRVRDLKGYKSWRKLKTRTTYIKFINVLWFLIILFFIVLFLPWTQNIRARGSVTALNPGQRPQNIHSAIAGRIEKWYINEGQNVAKGDTIVFISEIKDAYFDPELIKRTENLLKNKQLSVVSYQDKVQALDNQIQALERLLSLKLNQAKNKLEQAKLKISTDSMDLIAAKRAYEIAEEQLIRMEKLYQDGIKSLTDLETRKIKVQDTKAKMIYEENNFQSTVNDYLNAQIEITSIQNDYRDKLSKAQSDRFSALSALYETENEVTKLQNTLTNYTVRRGLYFITAPQDGFISRAITLGVGQTLKEGEIIATIVPNNFQVAAEIYIEPLDLPLVQPGQHARLIFDGWPNIVFSGWPNVSQGTYGATVFAVDNNISPNGKFRVLLVPDTTDVDWPNAVRMGSGVVGMALLKNVPVWYEIWRQFNGFPPDYYIESAGGEKEKEEKKEK